MTWGLGRRPGAGARWRVTAWAARGRRTMQTVFDGDDPDELEGLAGEWARAAEATLYAGPPPAPAGAWFNPAGFAGETETAREWVADYMMRMEESHR